MFRSVAVIGAGAMGSWFARRYLEMGVEVRVYDRVPERVGELAEAGAVGCDGVEEAVECVEAVLVAVPIASAAEVVAEVSELMREGVLAEVSSLKLPVIGALKRVRRSLTPLSVHPLFGPSAQRIEGARYALIPVRDEDAELRAARELFPGGEFTVVEAERHDEAMTYALSLTHLLSLAAALAIPEGLSETLKRIKGTSFNALLSMMRAALGESPETFAQVLTLNRGTVVVGEVFWERFGECLEAVRSGDAGRIREMLDEAVKAARRLS